VSTPKSVRIKADGKTRIVTTTAASIGALLAEQGVSVDSDDQVSPRVSGPVTSGLLVSLVRVSHKRSTTTQAVPFGTTKRSTSDLYVGQSRVVTKGKAGSRTVVFDVLVKNGKTSDKKVVSSTQTAAPIDRVLEVGTKKRKTSSGGGGGGGGTVGGGVDSLNWPALARCESGGNPRAVNPAGYYGLYQFSLSTWHSVGGSGNPINASPSEQLYRAKLLYKKAGAGQWGCGRHLFD
jgi:hypothetical protein